MNARLTTAHSPENIGLLLPTVSGWRAVPVQGRLTLGSEVGPGMVCGPGVEPRHCSLVASPQGLQLLARGPVDRKSVV